MLVYLFNPTRKSNCNEIYRRNMKLPNSTAELGSFVAKSNFFSESFLWELVTKTDVITWWKGFCRDTSLSQIAVRVLTMPCTSATTERSFSTQANIHTNKRNGLTTERAVKLIYIQHNTKLLKVNTNILSTKINRNFGESSIITQQAHTDDSAFSGIKKKRKICDETSEDSSVSLFIYSYLALTHLIFMKIFFAYSPLYHGIQKLVVTETLMMT